MIVHFLKYGVTACLMPGVPCNWPEGHLWTSNTSEVTCRACLDGMQWGDPTFEIIDVLKGRPAIKCRRCGSVSFHPKDVENHYCAQCHISHDDLWPPARRAWVEEGRKVI